MSSNEEFVLSIEYCVSGLFLIHNTHDSIQNRQPCVMALDGICLCDNCI